MKNTESGIFRHCAINSLPKKSQNFTKLSKFSKVDLGKLIFAECLSTPLAAFHKIFRSADIAILSEIFLLFASFYLLIQA